MRGYGFIRRFHGFTMVLQIFLRGFQVFMMVLKLQGSEVFCRNTTVAIMKLLVPSTGLTVKY